MVDMLNEVSYLIFHHHRFAYTPMLPEMNIASVECKGKRWPLIRPDISHKEIRLPANAGGANMNKDLSITRLRSWLLD